MKIGLIGCGEIARVGHGPSLVQYASEHPDVELAACCDIRPEAAEAFQKEFGFTECASDWEEMIRRVKPDALLLAVPVPLTAELSIRILKQRIPLMLEKPPGLYPEDTRRMQEAAIASGTPHQVAFNRRFMPVVRRFKEAAAGEAFTTWEYSFYRVGRIDPHYETTSIHAIDTLRYLVGADYRTVQFHYTPSGSDKDYVPAIWMEAEFLNGARGSIHIQPATGISLERFAAHGVNHYLYGALPFYAANGSLDGAGEILEARDGRIIRQERAAAAANHIMNGYYDEDASFLEDIRAGREPVNNLSTCLQSMEVAACIYRRDEWYRQE